MQSTTVNIVVSDQTMHRFHQQLKAVANSEMNILLLGETGAGKEISAGLIHEHSHRRTGPRVNLNCATLSEPLLESELFGHEAGAFTGAHRLKAGLLEVAKGGTVFLDEVGDLPLAIQGKLLRVIEERKVLRVGGLQARPIDVRFVAATNKDLAYEASKGRFRTDLLFRLDGITLVVPPLRERQGDIVPLAQHFIGQIASRMGLNLRPILSDEALKMLQAYHWPGNIRELRNVIERAAVLSGGGRILPVHLCLSSTHALPSPALPWSSQSHEGEETLRPLKVRNEAVERQRICEALEKFGGNQTKAARVLGIARGTLLSRLERYRIPRPRK